MTRVKSADLENEKAVRELLALGDRFYGDLGWWPAESPFEVVVGAVLTQNTAWRNVEKALDNLKKENALHPDILLGMHYGRLQRLIRPSGFYRAKRKTLLSLSRFFAERPFSEIENIATEDLRADLLRLKGVGQETADSILLYALGRKVFVVDSYTNRIFQRHGMIGEGASYSHVKALVERALRADHKTYNRFHAHIVETAKNHCGKADMDCRECPYRDHKRKRRA